jgi:hypothetical protein
MKRFFFLVIALIIYSIALNDIVIAAPQSYTARFTDCISWNFQDKPTPQTY